MKPFRTLDFSKVTAFIASISALLLVGCVQEDYLPTNSRHYVQIPPSTVKLMSDKAMAKESPILIRTYKQESEFEIWKKASDGKYALLKTYPMCRWSGQLGPKTREGDRQVPEGFYSLSPSQLNPNSSFYVSMNVGYPNSLDKAYGRSGGLIMVHGACSSAGCMSMTDEQIAEIYALTREAFTGGQSQVQIQSMPFRMTPKNFAKFRADPNIAFWKNLKEGADHFEVTKQEPKVAACGKKYVFNASARSGSFNAGEACPQMETDSAVASAVAEKSHDDNVKIAQLAAAGEHAVKRVYIDGDQHQSFRGTTTANGTVLTRAGRHVDVSQLSALEGVHEIPVEDHSAKPAKASAPLKALAQKPVLNPVLSRVLAPVLAPVLASATAPITTSSIQPIITQSLPVTTRSLDVPVVVSAAPPPSSTLYKRWFKAGEASQAEALAPIEPLPQAVSLQPPLKTTAAK